MARDLYGEMLSRALNRGAPPGHFPAYINPGEAAQLRAQGGGVPPGGGQYVANGLPSYQSTADWEAYAAMAEALGSSVEMPPAPERGDLPEFAPSRRDVAAAEVARLAALPQSAVAPVPVPAVEPTGPPPVSRVTPLSPEQLALAQAEASEPGLGRAPTPMDRQAAEPDLGVATYNRAAQAVEDAQRRNAEIAERRTAAMGQIDRQQDARDVAADEMAVMQQFRQAVPNDEMVELNLNLIDVTPNLTPEERSDLLSRDIPKGGIGRHSPGAGAARRGFERGIDVPMRLVRHLNQRSSRDGDYAVMSVNPLPGEHVSMPRELIALGPALAGSAFGFLAPPALGALSWAAGAPGISQWLGAKYPDSTLLNSRLGNLLTNPLGMRGGPEEVDPDAFAERWRQAIAQQNMERQNLDRRDFPFGDIRPLRERSFTRDPATERGDLDVPIARPPFVPPQSVTDEEDVVEEDVEGDARQLATLSLEDERRLRRNRELGEEQRRLAQALIPRQFA